MSFEGSTTNTSNGRFYSNGSGFDESSVHDHPPATSSNMTSPAGSLLGDGIGFGIAILTPTTVGGGSGGSGGNLDGISVDATVGQQQQPISYGEERNWVVVGILIALIVLLWIVLGAMLIIPLVRCIRRRMPVSKKRIERRYETIEGWLITKIVRPHDDGCERIPKKHSKKHATRRSTNCTTSDGDINDIECPHGECEPGNESCPSSIKHRESYDTAETTLVADDSFFQDPMDDDRECPICMDSFTVGDIVSWSSYEKCSHVYHHQCIKEWLLRHNNCPFCREIFLPVDQAQVKITMKVFKELSELRSRRAEKTFYCLQDGLVTLEEKPSSKILTTTTTTTPSTAPTSTTSAPSILRKCSHIKDESAHQLKEKLKPGVTRADLKKLRGDRCDKICYGDEEILEVIEDPNYDAEAVAALQNSPPSLVSPEESVPVGASQENVDSSTQGEDSHIEQVEHVEETIQSELDVETACGVEGDSLEAVEASLSITDDDAIIDCITNCQQSSPRVEDNSASLALAQCVTEVLLDETTSDLDRGKNMAADSSERDGDIENQAGHIVPLVESEPSSSPDQECNPHLLVDDESDDRISLELAEEKEHPMENQVHLCGISDTMLAIIANETPGPCAVKSESEQSSSATSCSGSSADSCLFDDKSEDSRVQGAPRRSSNRLASF